MQVCANLVPTISDLCMTFFVAEWNFSKLNHSFCPSRVFPHTSGQRASYGVTNTYGLVRMSRTSEVKFLKWWIFGCRNVKKIMFSKCLGNQSPGIRVTSGTLQECFWVIPVAGGWLSRMFIENGISMMNFRRQRFRGIVNSIRNRVWITRTFTTHPGGNKIDGLLPASSHHFVTFRRPKIHHLRNFPPQILDILATKLDETFASGCAIAICMDKNYYCAEWTCQFREVHSTTKKKQF